MIARFGPDGPDYKSGMGAATRSADPHLVEARRRAVERGLVPGELRE